MHVFMSTLCLYAYKYVSAHVCLSGWMDGWLAYWLDAWMDWMDGCMPACLPACLFVQTYPRPKRDSHAASKSRFSYALRQGSQVRLLFFIEYTDEFRPIARPQGSILEV